MKRTGGKAYDLTANDILGKNLRSICRPAEVERYCESEEYTFARDIITAVGNNL